MDLSLVTWEVRHARIDIIIGLSYLLALWIFTMHFEVFRGRASWEYLESLIQFLIGLTHVESPGYPLAASLKSNTQIFRGLWGNQTPPSVAAELPKDWDICFHCALWKVLISSPPANTGLAAKPANFCLLLTPGWPTACQAAFENYLLLLGFSITGIYYAQRVHHTHTLPYCRKYLANRSKVKNARSIFLFISRKGFLCHKSGPWTNQQKAVSKAPDD